jgi:hypothetical protein
MSAKEAWRTLAVLLWVLGLVVGYIVTAAILGLICVAIGQRKCNTSGDNQNDGG